MQFLQRLVQFGENLQRLSRNFHVHDSAVFFTPSTRDKLLLFQSINQSSDGRHHLNHSISDLQGWQWLSGHARDRQNPVDLAKLATDIPMSLVTQV